MFNFDEFMAIRLKQHSWWPWTLKINYKIYIHWYQIYGTIYSKVALRTLSWNNNSCWPGNQMLVLFCQSHIFSLTNWLSIVGVASTSTCNSCNTLGHAIGQVAKGVCSHIPPFFLEGLAQFSHVLWLDISSIYSPLQSIPQMFNWVAIRWEWRLV